MGKTEQNTDGAEALLRKMLKENGFQPKSPDVKIAWETFKAMCDVKFECEEDELLFETGVYDFSGKDMFFLSVVRQFTIIEEDGEYDYVEQLHMDFAYEPEKELKELVKTIWTYEYDGDFGRFFEEVEKCQAFCVPRDGYLPVEFELYFDET